MNLWLQGFKDLNIKLQTFSVHKRYMLQYKFKITLLGAAVSLQAVQVWYVLAAWIYGYNAILIL